MEKILKLYTYVDGVQDTPFPNEEHQVVTSTFRSDYKRMGGAPTISCTIMHHLCLDKLWTDNVYATFNGEKFFIKQIPSSSFDNTDARYKHELELVSERFVLDNVYFYDVVDSSANYDKPVSNSSKFVFFGDIREFASRLNQSLQYSKVGYSVVVDDGISSESKMVSFQDQFFSNAIQESYNTYNIPYYFVGKVIHFGYTNNAITHTFKYGQDESLLSIQKQNANYKIVNRVTGVGSSDNIPYYYPNDYESKEEVEANGGVWINPQTNLMPSIYRETFGDERFYKALNGTYQIPNSNEYYEFSNPYIEGKPKEHIVNFEDVKPTIKGMVNSNGMRIDMFQEFAYDLNDNDETDEEGNYLHPYFFAKLRRFDGEHGFNLFDHAIDEQEMTISMTSGNCGACEFVIGVDETTQKNTVQVDASGNLERDSDGNVKFGTPQDKQNDTINNEVWIALRKDVDTFGVIMPNATNNYKPSVNDTFVILHIDLPKAYILAAEDNLKNQLIEYMALNNSEKFNFSISFSRIFFAEHPDILAQLNENARIQIEYDNINYELYISSYSYSMSNDKPLPEIRVELSDALTISQNALQTAISEVKSEILQSGVGVSGGDILKRGLKYFLRKDTDDRSKGKISTDKALEVGRFVQGASGAIIQVDANTGQTTAELDKLYVRMKAYFETLEIINTNSIGGKLILSPSGSIRCNNVDEYEDYYRCYFLNEQDGEKVENRFKVGDQAFSQMFNAKEGVSNNISNHYYWRLVVGVGENYIDLSKSDADDGSDVPKIGDVINHRGNRNDIDRQNFIEFSSVGTNAPYITLFQGVNSYSLTNKEFVSFGYDQSTGRAYMNVYGDMFFGNRDESSYIKYNPTDGLVVKGKLSVGSTYNGSEIGSLFEKQQEDLEKFSESVTKEFENIRKEMDGAIDTWFGDEQPTLDNYPASDWTTNEMKDSHLGDLFYTNDGKAYRFQYTDSNGYYWAAIEDSEVVKALELAQKALDTADGKRRVFIEQPYPPYDLGDLWAAGENQPLMRCINARESGSYYASDWAIADDSHAYTDAIKSSLETIIDGYYYLKQALKEDTTIEGGLIQSSLLKLGYTDINGVYHTMSGTNGIYDSSLLGGGIATWWGGEMYDLANYYDWDGDKWNPKSGITIPTTIPSGLIRFDGTGYFAKGNFWWDENGEIHADPTALLLSFDAETGDETLASTIINLRKTMELFASMWVKKEDNSGNEYLYTSLPIATSSGITMYGGDSIDAPTIMDAILYDDTTLGINSEGKLYVKGGSGGGLDITALQNYLTQNSYLNVTEGDGRYLKLSGGILEGWVGLPIGTAIYDGTENGQTLLGFTADGTTLRLGSNYTITRLRGTSLTYNDSVVLHAGNYSSYALPLSGGTLTGALNLPIDTYNYIGSSIALWVKSDTPNALRLYTPSGLPSIAFFNNDGWKGTLGVNENSDLLWTSNKVWHEGNDTSLMKHYRTSNIDLNSIITTQPRIVEVNTSTNAPTTNQWHQVMNWGSGDSAYGCQIANCYTKLDSSLYYRFKVSGSWSDWRTIASTDSNVASATKLQTARTIWGQSFDGTGDITGQLNITTGTNVALTYGTGLLTLGTMASVHIAIDTNDIQAKANGTTASTLYLNDYGGNVSMCGNGGNVGIGTSGPSYKLHVQGDGYYNSNLSVAGGLYVGNSSVGYMQLTRPSANYITTPSSGYLTFCMGGNALSVTTSNLVLYQHNIAMALSGGNVGIGTASPAYKLHVNGDFVSHSVKIHDNNVIDAIDSRKLHLNYYATTDMSLCYGGGNVGIGTTSPAYKFHVAGDSYLAGVCYINKYTTYDSQPYTANPEVVARIGTFDHLGGLVIQFGSAADTNVNGRFEIIDKSWKVALFSVDTSGNVLANGGITMYSDQRKKTILRNVELSLKEIANAPLIEHYYNSDDKKTTHVGSIAQYWAGMNDWFCKLDNEGYYTMEIQNAALASAISVARELDRYETKTDKTIKKLKKRICELEEEVERLKAN